MDDSKIMAKTWWRFLKSGAESEKPHYFERLRFELARNRLLPEDIGVDRKEFEDFRNKYGNPNSGDDYFFVSTVSLR